MKFNRCDHANSDGIINQLNKQYPGLNVIIGTKTKDYQTNHKNVVSKPVSASQSMYDE